MDTHGQQGLPPGVAEMTPGPDLLHVLLQVDVDTLSAHDAVIVAAAWERQQAYAAAQQAKAIHALARQPEYDTCTMPATDGDGVPVRHEHDAQRACADELSLKLRWTPAHARGRVMLARELGTVLRPTRDALEAGLIDSYKAKLIAERTRVLDDPQARRRVQVKVLPKAMVRTAAQLDRTLRAAVIAADPQAAEQRRADAAKRRRVQRPEPADLDGASGMARMGLEGPGEDLLALWTAVDAAARHAREHGDTRNLDQLRFDTLCGLGWAGLDLGHLGCCNPACTHNGPKAHPFSQSHGRAAQVQVTVPYTVFTTTRTADNDTGTGTDDAAEDGVLGDGQVAHLHGFGPVTANAARRVATEGSMRRLLTDDTHGQVLEYGRTTYTPPQHLADFVIARDITCRFPTCDRPAREADLDHKHPWDHGGHTGASNLWCLHDGHHQQKTHHGFDIETDHEGITWWITPARHRYRVEPTAVGLITKPPPPPDPEPPPF